MALLDDCSILVTLACVTLSPLEALPAVVLPITMALPVVVVLLMVLFTAALLVLVMVVSLSVSVEAVLLLPLPVLDTELPLDAVGLLEVLSEEEGDEDGLLCVAGFGLGAPTTVDPAGGVAVERITWRYEP